MPTRRELEQIEEEIWELKKCFNCDMQDEPPKTSGGGRYTLIIWNRDHTRKLVLHVNLEYSSPLAVTEIRYSSEPFEKEWITCILRTLEFVKCSEIADVLATFREIVKDFKEIENDEDEEKFLVKYEFRRIR